MERGDKNETMQPSLGELNEQHHEHKKLINEDLTFNLFRSN